MIPKFHETMLPILKVLKDDKSRPLIEVSNILENEFFKLTDDEKSERVSNGESRFFDRVSWGRTYLKKAGLIEQPRRGEVKITDEGKRVVDSNIEIIDVDFLSQYPTFLEFKAGNKNKTKEEVIESISQKMSPQDMIDVGFQNIQDALKDELIEKLRGTNPYFFEKVVLILFQKMGYGDFKETPKSRDGGIDGIINQDKLGLEKIHIQAKRYAKDNKVREPDIRNFIGAMSGDANKGIFVTTSFFDEGAINKAKGDHNHKIILIDGNMLTDLMIKYNIGIQEKSNYEVKEVDADFFDEF
jgi:restriction system protein